MAKDKYKNTSIIREALSGSNGFGSAKRILGALIVIVCLCCIVYFAITEGATENVKDLIDTSLIIACALLGLSSITSIWRPYKQSNHNKTDDAL